MRVRGQVIEQERHRFVHVGGLDDVVVVEHEDELARDHAEVVHERGDDGRRRRRGRLQDGHRAGRGVRDGGADGRHDVRPEPGRVVVTDVERQPGGCGAVVGGTEPFGDEGRLAEPRRRGDEREQGQVVVGEPVRQPRTIDGRAPAARPVELRLEERADDGRDRIARRAHHAGMQPCACRNGNVADPRAQVITAEGAGPAAAIRDQRRPRAGRRRARAARARRGGLSPAPRWGGSAGGEMVRRMAGVALVGPSRRVALASRPRARPSLPAGTPVRTRERGAGPGAVTRPTGGARR